MIFSGPLQPPALGAAIASARLHLSAEFPGLQAELLDRIRWCNELMEGLGVPLASAAEAPIRFVQVGLPQVAYALVGRLMDAGFFTNVAMFPAVPMRQAGVRFTLTRHQSREDIQRLVEAIAELLPEVTDSARGQRRIRPRLHLSTRHQDLTVPAAFTLQHETTIEALPEATWNEWLGNRGSFSWNGLRFLESTFRERAETENDWRFHYFVVRDSTQNPVLATFFTEALWKDDMLESEGVSRAVEARRAGDPYYLTSRNLAMGSLLTEGVHLYLDRSRDWRGAIKVLLEAIAREQGRVGAQSLVLRDLPADDPEMDAFLLGQGFVKVAMPESLSLEITWEDEEGFLSHLSQYARKHQRKNVRPWNDAYEVEVLGRGGRVPNRAELEHFYRLYRNVKAQSLELNTFDLPDDLFERMLPHPCWELLTLRLKPEFGGDGGPVHGVLASFIGPEQYAPMIIGLDYRFVRSHGLYRQFLRHMVKRAEHHGSRRVLFGMGASFEKRRFGAKVQPRCAYFQASDHYALEVLAQMRANCAGG